MHLFVASHLVASSTRTCAARTDARKERRALTRGRSYEDASNRVKKKNIYIKAWKIKFYKIDKIDDRDKIYFSLSVPLLIHSIYLLGAQKNTYGVPHPYALILHGLIFKCKLERKFLLNTLPSYMLRSALLCAKDARWSAKPRLITKREEKKKEQSVYYVSHENPFSEDGNRFDSVHAYLDLPLHTYAAGNQTNLSHLAYSFPWIYISMRNIVYLYALSQMFVGDLCIYM